MHQTMPLQTRLRGLFLIGVALALALAVRPAQAQPNTGLHAAFELSVGSGVVPLIVTTLNTSVGAETWRWDFDDGTVSTEREPTHIYVRPGLFVVELEACRGALCATATAVINIEGRDELDGGLILDGRRVRGAINQPGDRDEWTFIGTAGGHVTATLAPDLGSPLDPVLRLFGPDGALVAFNDDVEGTPTAAIRDVELPQSGFYTIETGAFLDTVGVYVLSLDVAGPNAVRAAFGVTPPTGVAPHAITLINDSRNATRYLWEFGDGTTSTAVAPTHEYRQAGRFTIRLTACRDYTCEEAHASVVVEADDGGPAVSGEPVRNRLDYEDDIDRFTFEAPAGAETTIDLIAVDDVFDALLFLFGPNGDEVAMDDDGGDGLNARIANIILPEAGAYTIDVLAFPGTGIGEYELLLSLDPEPVVRAAVVVTPTSFVAPANVAFADASLGGPTSWSWDLGDGTTATGATVTHRYVEPGTYVVLLEACNSRSCDTTSVLLRIGADTDGGAIELDQTAFGAIDGPGDVDDWTFEGTADEIVTIAVVADNAGFDPFLELLTPDGAILTSDDDSGGDLQPLIRGVVLPASGTYTIRVRAFGEEATGPYRLELSVDSGSP